MNVKTLIEILSTQDPNFDREVFVEWDGCSQSKKVIGMKYDSDLDRYVLLCKKTPED